MAEQLCLTWNDCKNHMMNGFKQLLVNQSLVDVTLVCDGMSLKAHKTVLSACSPLFQTLFLANPCQHPIVILKDVKYAEVRALLEIIYVGKANIPQNQWLTVKKVAESLKMMEIAEAINGKTQSDELSQQLVSRPNEPPTKRRKRGSQKTSQNELSDSQASLSRNPDSDLEEMCNLKTSSEACATKTFFSEDNLSVGPLKESLQNNHPDQLSMKQQRRPRKNSNDSSRSTSDSSETSQRPKSSGELAASEQDDLISNLRKAVKTLKEKGILSTDENDKSADEPLATNIINIDSNIEEITLDEEQDDEDDDELILTDVVLPKHYTSLLQSTTETKQQSSSEISQRKEGFNEKENNQTARRLSNSGSQDEPPSKRRKRRRQKASQSKKTNEEPNTIVLDQDSDVELEVIPLEPSRSFSTAAAATDNMSPCQSPQQHLDEQDIEQVFAPNENSSPELNKLSENVLTTDAIPSPSNEQVVDSTSCLQTAPDSSDSVLLPYSVYEHPKSPPGHLDAQNELFLIMEPEQEPEQEIEEMSHDIHSSMDEAEGHDLSPVVKTVEEKQDEENCHEMEDATGTHELSTAMNTDIELNEAAVAQDHESADQDHESAAQDLLLLMVETVHEEIN